MNITKEKLRKLAEAATQGRWISQNIRGSGIEMRVPYKDSTRLTFVGVFRALPEEWNKELWANAEYIAAANPTAILSLLDEIGKLQAQVTELTLDRDEFQQMQAEPVAYWMPMETAPLTGECVLLLIENPDHPLEDENPSVSLGSYAVFGGPKQDPHWCFAGWDWSFDSYRRGEGTPIGWMPLPIRLAPNVAPQPPLAVPAEKRTLWECRGCGHLHGEKLSSCDCMENEANEYNEWTAAPKGAV